MTERERAVLLLTHLCESHARQPGKDLVLWGGAGVAQSFVRLGLVDEYRLLVHPVALGSGKALFADITERMTLQLVSSKSYDSGLVALHYVSGSGSNR